MNTVARPIPRGSGLPSDAELTLRDGLRVWERRLRRERLGTWVIRGAGAALVAACAVLLVGWVTPVAESELRPFAAGVTLVPLLAAAAYALWPRRHIRHAAELDQRLSTSGDRLTTAWSFRQSEEFVVRLQRTDALQRLSQFAPERDLRWQPQRPELIAVGVLALLTLLLMMTPSPQQHVLDQRAVEQNSVLQASQQLDTLRQAAGASNSLTPDQARQLDELLQRAQTDLQGAQTPCRRRLPSLPALRTRLHSSFRQPRRRTLRDEALAAMSETLAAEPQTQALASALQQENAQATSDAVRNITSKADSLSDVERQALSRALQRAANVGRSDARSSSALSNAAQAVAAGASADAAMSQVDAALRDSIQASQSQAAVEATAQQLHDLQARLLAFWGSADRIRALTRRQHRPRRQRAGRARPIAIIRASGTPRSAARRRRGSLDIWSPHGSGSRPRARASARARTLPRARCRPTRKPPRTSSCPGRAGNGSADQSQDVVTQPFSVTGAPRPYRDVLNQYAQSSRDYVDRPDISPAVRDLVKQYFQELESNQ